MSGGLAALLERAGIEADGLELLAGDASTRRYHRGRAAGGLSVVVMEGGEPGPFAGWARAYESLGLRVPRVLDLDEQAGAMVLEDLGDEMLQHRVERLGPTACLPFYETAVSWHRTLVERGAGLRVPGSTGERDPLVAERLAWEMDFLLAHALGLEQAELPAAAQESAQPLARARGLLRRLCEDLHALSPAPLATCHRDYHSRNLVVTPAGELAVIDFQDSRLGPRAYDLASLLWDPYVDLPGAMIAELQERARPPDSSAADWDREVRLAAGQRLLKAAGSYAMLGRTRGREEYLAWWEPALSRAFDRLTGAWGSAGRLEQSLRAAGLDW